MWTEIKRLFVRRRPNQQDDIRVFPDEASHEPVFPGFEKCMSMMREPDPWRQEDGFHWLLAHASEYVAELIHEYRTESDHGLRCWLLELLGEARSSEAVPVFKEALGSSEASLRQWAIWGLQKLGSAEARKILEEAQPSAEGNAAPPRPSP